MSSAEDYFSRPAALAPPVTAADVPEHPAVIQPAQSAAADRTMVWQGTQRSYPFGEPIPELVARPLSAFGAAPATTTTALPLLLAVAAAVAGGLYAGPWGAGAGILLTGAVVNGYRYMANADGERKTHGVFTVLAAGGGGYMAYKAHKARTARGETHV
jgi:hypothetical protein